MLARPPRRLRRRPTVEFELKLFPNNQLGGDTDMFSQLRSGALECFTLSGVNVLSTLVPSAAIWGVGFAWKDYPTLWNALDGKFGAHLRSQIDKAGLVVLEKIWDNGFRQVTTSVRPIVTPTDLQGLKIRVPVSALWTSLFKSLGASPTEYQLRGSLLSAADKDRRRTGESAGDHFCSKALRSAEVLFADQPYVGRLVVSHQSARMAGCPG